MKEKNHERTIQHLGNQDKNKPAEVAEDLAREAEHEYLKQTGELWRLHFVETLEKIDESEAREQSEREIA